MRFCCFEVVGLWLCWIGLYCVGNGFFVGDVEIVFIGDSDLFGEDGFIELCFEYVLVEWNYNVFLML